MERGYAGGVAGGGRWRNAGETMAGRNMAAKWAAAGLAPAQASVAAESMVRAATQGAVRRTSGGVVLKKLGPDAPGAKRLAARYGEALVCVRYREDAAAQRRYTTVELVVDLRPLPPPVMVRIGFEEAELRSRVKAAGGLWDGKRKLWRVPVPVVCELKLSRRVVRADT